VKLTSYSAAKQLLLIQVQRRQFGHHRFLAVWRLLRRQCRCVMIGDPFASDIYGTLTHRRRLTACPTLASVIIRRYYYDYASQLTVVARLACDVRNPHNVVYKV